MKRLENKVAVVYGDGATGGAVAKAFARVGAKVFLTGRTLKKLTAIADEILSGGPQKLQPGVWLCKGMVVLSCTRRMQAG